MSILRYRSPHEPTRTRAKVIGISVVVIAVAALVYTLWPKRMGEQRAIASVNVCGQVQIVPTDGQSLAWQSRTFAHRELTWQNEPGTLVLWSNGSATFRSDAGVDVDLGSTKFLNASCDFGG